MADRTSTVRVNVIADSSGAASKLGGFAKVAGAAALGVGALAVGAAVGADKLYSYADAQDDANASVAQGIKTMGLFGKAQGDVTKRILDQATALSKATAVDVTSIKTTQAKLLTFKELAKTADTAGGAFDRATQAAVDMAAKGFGDAESNAVQLGKALQDPANGLAALGKTGALTKDQIKNIGDEFKRTGDISKAQGDILAAVETQVKGTAEATAGGFELMKNRASLFAQELASRALPYLDAFGTFMINKGGPAIMQFAQAAGEFLIPKLQQLGGFLQGTVIPAVQRLASSFAENVLPKMRALAGFIEERVIPVIGDLGSFIVDKVVPVLGGILSGVLQGARDGFANVAGAVKRNEPELRDMGEALKKVGQFIVENVLPVVGDFYKNYLPLLGSAIGTAIDVIAGIVTAFQNVYDAAKDVAGAIQDVIDKVNNLPGAGALGALADAVSRTSTGGGGGGGMSPGDIRYAYENQQRPIVVNVPGGFIGDEAKLASELKRILRGDAIRFGV